ncbi:alanine racemase [Parvularcula oceani]|uniref:alanine racemase n=1 Tax=Parvularcula oceani TaxID=1247963 RepID=UPI00068E02FA|nr:alanine racemase [Parvularcula oceani]
MSLSPSRPTLTVDLAALGRNAESLRARRSGAELAAVVKADAYGFGAEEVARHLVEKCGIRTLFVAHAAQARQVRQAINRPALPTADIYVLNGYSDADGHLFDMLSLRPVLNTLDEARIWARRGGACAVMIDIGMNRLGIAADELESLPAETGLDPADLRLVLMHLSHTATPKDEQNRLQQELFAMVRKASRESFPRAGFSLSASGGLFLEDAPEESLSRPGIALYGASPDGRPENALEAVATLSAPVLLTRMIEAGETAGYGGTWTAARRSRLAVLAMGYADGYLRSLSNRGVVWLGGRECPVVGKVSMDLLIVDATDCEEEIVPGQHAELFGDRIKVDRLAELGGTIAYELFTAVGDRVERRYTR